MCRETKEQRQDRYCGNPKPEEIRKPTSVREETLSCFRIRAKRYAGVDLSKFTDDELWKLMWEKTAEIAKMKCPACGKDTTELPDKEYIDNYYKKAQAKPICYVCSNIIEDHQARVIEGARRASILIRHIGCTNSVTITKQHAQSLIKLIKEFASVIFLANWATPSYINELGEDLND